MSSSAETLIRTSEVTKERVKYLAGALALTQPEVVERAVVELIQSAKPEIDRIEEALLEGNLHNLETARFDFRNKLSDEGRVIKPGANLYPRTF